MKRIGFAAFLTAFALSSAAMAESAYHSKAIGKDGSRWRAPLCISSLGMQFGTFQLTDEAIDAQVLALRRAQAQVGVAEQDFDVLGFGETRE